MTRFTGPSHSPRTNNASHSLDEFVILTSTGLVLFDQSFAAPVSVSPVNELISSLISQSTTSESVQKTVRGPHSLVWTWSNDIQVIFVAAYQRILQLGYVEQLVQAVKRAFVERYGEAVSLLRKGMAAGKQIGQQGFEALFKDWKPLFLDILRQFESKDSLQRKSKQSAFALNDAATDSQSASEAEAQTPSKDAETPLDAQTIAKNLAALKARQKVRKASGKNGASSIDSSPASTPGRPKKEATKWGDKANVVSEQDIASFDHSFDTAPDDDALAERTAALNLKPSSGILEDYTAPTHSSSTNGASTSSVASSIWSFFSTSKTLTAQDLKPSIDKMRSHLQSKNVASSIADSLCDSVQSSLLSTKASAFSSASAAQRAVRQAMENVLTRTLAPGTGTDLLSEIQVKRGARRGDTSKHGIDPYAMTFVGVNGVGKSTNLSKIAYWLLSNDLKVLIAACDTFRSGAVEQLRIHVKNLQKLGVGHVSLYEKGYGKDASLIAKEAIAQAKADGTDVVLIDTAGRMQDNEPLMRALAKLIQVNRPDKIVFVGEALAGNEAVDQLAKFNRSLRDFGGREVDGMLLTKFDTIDDKVGAALSMTYTSGKPILFVGVGQTYADLRALRVKHIVDALLSGL